MMYRMYPIIVNMLKKYDIKIHYQPATNSFLITATRYDSKKKYIEVDCKDIKECGLDTILYNIKYFGGLDE